MTDRFRRRLSRKGQWRVHVKRAIEQVIGREGETATFLSRCLFNSELRVIGFAPRHLSRCAAFLF